MSFDFCEWSRHSPAWDSPTREFPGWRIPCPVTWSTQTDLGHHVRCPLMSSFNKKLVFIDRSLVKLLNINLHENVCRHFRICISTDGRKTWFKRHSTGFKRASPSPPPRLEGKLTPLGRGIKSHTHILRYSALMLTSNAFVLLYACSSLLM